MHNKTAERVAAKLGEWIGHFQAPDILQCVNGKEFKGMVVTLMKRFQTKIVLGKPRTPRTQGLVEQANGVVETRLAKWKSQTGRSDWSNSLPDIAISINRTVHSATKHTLFELVFGRKDFPKPDLTQQELILEDEDGIPIDMNDPTKDLED